MTYILLQLRRLPWWALALTVLNALCARSALAAPTDADRATARELAQEGYAALQQKNYAVAEDRFRRAGELVYAPTIAVDHARALIGLGRLVEAYERYSLVLREDVAANAPDSWKRALEDAEREIEAVKPRLAWIVLNVEGPKEPRVTIDGRLIPNASLGARRAIDPGRRKLRVTADGYVSGGEIITLREGEERELTMTLERPPSIELEEAKAGGEVSPSKPKRSLLPIIAFGAGGVGLGVGAITGVMALSAHSSLSESCPDGLCRPQNPAEKATFERDRDRYRSLSTISGIAFGVGIAGAVTGTVLLVTSSPESPPPSDTASLEPVIGPAYVGLRGRL